MIKIIKHYQFWAILTKINFEIMLKIKLSYIVELIGTFLLTAVVIGSGIMAENLSQGNDAVALLGNTIELDLFSLF